MDINFFKARTVLSLAICSALALTTATSCSMGSKSGETEAQSDYISSIQKGIDGLSNFGSPYLISVGAVTPTSASYAIRVVDGDNSYQQYSYDETAGIGTISYEAAQDTQFMLYDWMTLSGTGYVLNQDYLYDDTQPQWLMLPKNYVGKQGSRRTLYLSDVIDSMKNVEETDPMQANLGSGNVSLTVYEGDIPASEVRGILSMDSIGLYESFLEEAQSEKDDNMISLMNYYIDDLDMDYTFSNAEFKIGIYNDVVRYFEITVGGLGSCMVFTQTVLEMNSELAYAAPTFSNVKDYYESLSEVADYVAKYDSYEDAIQSLYTSDPNVLPTPVETTVAVGEEGSLETTTAEEAEGSSASSASTTIEK